MSPHDPQDQCMPDRDATTTAAQQVREEEDVGALKAKIAELEEARDKAVADADGNWDLLMETQEKAQRCEEAEMREQNTAQENAALMNENSRLRTQYRDNMARQQHAHARESAAKDDRIRAQEEIIKDLEAEKAFLNLPKPGADAPSTTVEALTEALEHLQLENEKLRKKNAEAEKEDADADAVGRTAKKRKRAPRKGGR